MSPKKKKVGYVVVGVNGAKQLGSENILWYGCVVGTLFRTRRGAQNAINRSLAYAKAHKYDNDAWMEHTICELRSR